MKLPSTLPAKGALLLYVALLLAAALLFAPQRLSTDLLGIFPQNGPVTQLRDAASLQTLNRLLVLSKGFDAPSRQRIEAIAAALEAVEGIERIDYRSDRFDGKLTEALRAGYYQRAQFDPKPLDDASLKAAMQGLYDRISSAFLFVPLDSSDPLGLFSDPLRRNAPAGRDGYLRLGEEGYLLSATLSVPVSDAEASAKLMTAVEAVTRPFGGEVSAFAPHFFTAQNSAKIKGEVNLIVTATMVLLLLFYAVALRNFRVLLITSAVLGGSLFVGLSVVTACFEEVSVFTLAFGAGIVMMAVDYFFHYYFHGYYGSAAPGARRKVFFAFMTTAGGFVILFFADFPLIKQLSLFALSALSFAYFQFTFLLAPFRFEPKRTRLRMPAPSAGLLRPHYVTLVGVLMLAMALPRLEFDGELKRLDYQNRGLQELQARFAAASEAQRPLLIYGGNLDAVIARAEALKVRYPKLRSAADLYRSEMAYAAYTARLEAAGIPGLGERVEAIGEQVGFRKGTFEGAYAFARHAMARPTPDPALLETLGYETRQTPSGRWVSLAYINADAVQGFEAPEGVVLLNASKMLEASVESVGTQLLLIGAATLGAIALLLVMLLKGDALRALNYIIVPLGAILLLLSLTAPLSLMHLFALIIVMVAGIDYGIYMSDPEAQTDEAIYYAMLTTFAGFGIFVFSNIGALGHIGVVIATGIVAVFALQRLQLRRG